MGLTTEPEASTFARSTWATVLERDIDLLLLDLLHTSESFRNWLLASAASEFVSADATPTFVGAWHSVNTPTGESDIEAEWVTADRQRLVVLIEDKLGAAFQPEQGTRYQARAAGYVASGRAAVTRTILMAPSAYPARDPNGAAPFERHITLESIREWCRSADADGRGSYIARFLDHALRRYRAGARPAASVAGGIGATVGGKRHYPELYAVIQHVLETHTSELPLSVSNSSPGEWVYLRFEGCDGASLRWRLADHWVELVLSAGRVDRSSLEQALAANPLARAAVADRGRTEHVVWVPTPELDLAASADIQSDAIARSLAVAGDLARWYIAAKSLLRPSTAE